MKKFDSILIQGYWFEEGLFWTIGANGYKSDNDDEPEEIETDPHCLGEEYSREDVLGQLENIADMWLSQGLSDSITILIDGNEVKTKKLCTHAAYEVTVGNIGSVYKGVDLKDAKEFYRSYSSSSNAEYGRAAGEDVTLIAISPNGDSEILEDHVGSKEN